MFNTVRYRFILLLTVAGCASIIGGILNEKNEFSDLPVTQELKIVPNDDHDRLDTYENSIGMKLISIPLGDFLMGYSETPLPESLTQGRPYRINGDFDEQPYHNVSITKPIFMSTLEVTNSQYKLFDPLHETDLYGFSWNDNDAVVMVSWYDAVEFCMWLSDLEGMIYRLPTEAEWEYAARSGTRTYFYMGNRFPESEYKYQENSWLPGRREDGDVVPLTVGMFLPNFFGLYDMHGNVEEWTSDWYGPYTADSQTNPEGPSTGTFKVTRGGSHSTVPYYLRSANRIGALPSDRSWYTGFRVVLDKAAPADYWDVQREAIKKQKADFKIELPQTKLPQFEPPKQSDKPFLETLQYVNVPASSTMQPPFTYHNHDPAVMPLPNGDVFAIWYTCYSESERELAVAYSRLPAGSSQWEEAKLFWDAPDRNDHAPGLFFDYNTNTLYHYTSQSAAATWGSPAVLMRMSRDFGHTWSSARFLMPEHQLRHMVVETVFETSKGVWVMPCDNTTYGSGGTSVHLSYDQGITWEDTGSDVLGIHGAILERDDGSLYAVGRGNDINGSLARSISYDMGHSWVSAASGLPGIISYQRAVILHLNEGPLLYMGFSSPAYMTFYDSHNDIVRRVSGLFTALSYDNGETWTDHKLISDNTMGKPVQTLDGNYILQSWKISEPKGYLSARQHTDGVIHLISSRQHYQFNLAWLESAAAVPPQSDFHTILHTTPLTIAHVDSNDGQVISVTTVGNGVEGTIVGSFHNYLTQELFLWSFEDGNGFDPTFWVLDSDKLMLKRSWVHKMPSLTLARPNIAAKLGQDGTVLYVVSANEIVFPNILIQQLDQEGALTQDMVANGDSESISTPLAVVPEVALYISDNNLWIPVISTRPITGDTYYTIIWAQLNSNYSETRGYFYRNEWWSMMFYDPITSQLYFTVTDQTTNSSLLFFYNSDASATEFEHAFPGYVSPCASFDEVSLKWKLGCDVVYEYDTLEHKPGVKFSVGTNSLVSFTYFGVHY